MPIKYEITFRYAVRDDIPLIFDFIKKLLIMKRFRKPLLPQKSFLMNGCLKSRGQKLFLQY